MKKLLTLVLLCCCGLAGGQETDEADARFRDWLDELRQEARERGYSEETLELAFSEITPPVQRVLNKDRSQPEVVQTYDDYLRRRVSDWKLDTGSRLLAEHRELFARIDGAYGVDPRVLAAIWGMESNFGTFPITEPLFNVLATLAYDKRRAKLFRAQFFAALELLESGFPGYEKLTSSWAGAMGQPQFIPETYQRLAVDFDGDGRRDIWDSEADALASIANLLNSFGWRSDQRWGREVLLPEGGETRFASGDGEGVAAPEACVRYRSLGAWQSAERWRELGLRQSDGEALPAGATPMALIPADAGDGRGYLVAENFCVLMRFNASFKYALSIGLLADRLEYGEG